jgi:hypothetical protein
MKQAFCFGNSFLIVSGLTQNCFVRTQNKVASSLCGVHTAQQKPCCVSPKCITLMLERSEYFGLHRTDRNAQTVQHYIFGNTQFLPIFQAKPISIAQR